VGRHETSDAMETESPKQTPDLLDGYDPAEVTAAGLKMHPRTLRKMDERGDGPPKTVIGRKVYYRRESVRAWLASQEQRRTGKGRR